MQELLEWMEYIEDTRQQTKVRHTLKDILVIGKRKIIRRIVLP